MSITCTCIGFCICGLIRRGITVLPADKPISKFIVIDSNGVLRKPRGPLGWTITESIGMAIVNPRALKHLNKKKMV